MKSLRTWSVFVVLAGCASSGGMSAASSSTPCANNAGINLPPGFCASIFADSLGKARYLAIAENGDVYVSIEGTNPQQPTPNAPAFIALRDTNHDGRADQIERIGKVGNTGIALSNGYLYVDQGEKINRYARPAGQLVPSTSMETVVAGFPMNPGHRARNFVITRDGNLLVNVGSPSNACQVQDRKLESPGKDPCPELEPRAGIWKFSATTLNQQYSPSAR